MSFRITGLSPEPFRSLYGLSEAALAGHGARRYITEHASGFPDRITLRDASPGDAVLLVNYLHQPANTPYRASHAVFVREGADAAYDETDQVPESLRSRILSVRAFDAAHMIVDADLAEGGALEHLVTRLFDNPSVAYLHAHYAKYGCYAARVDRV